MATQIKSITDTPANIVSDLSMSSGSTYLIRAIGSSSVYLAEAASAPSTTRRACCAVQVGASLAPCGILIPAPLYPGMPSTHPWPMMRSNSNVAAVLAIFAAACGDITEPPAPHAAVTSVSVDATQGPIDRRLSVTLDQPGAIAVDYWSATTPVLRVTSTDFALNHTVFLPRLRANGQYDYEVRAVDDARQGEPVPGQFATDSLPLELRDLQFYVIGAATFPLTLVEVKGGLDAHVIVDQDGEIVWYWLGGGEVGSAFTRLANGNFVFNEDNDLVVVTPAGQVVARMQKTVDMGQGFRQGTHHDMAVTPSNTVLFLAYDDRVVDNVTWTGEAVWEWDFEADLLTKRWSSFDFLAPDVDIGGWTSPEDWLHANSLSIGPRGNVVLSFFWLNQIISIAPDYASLEWRLGGPGSTIAPDGGVLLGGQHTATEIEQDRVLLFDNGRYEPGGPVRGTPFSRGVELSLDRGSGTATIVWEFRPNPDIFAAIVSAARRLDNGNTVVTFGTGEAVPGPSRGFGTSTGPISVYEVTAAGRIVWYMRVDGISAVYRMTPISDIGGEMPLQQ